MKWIGVSLVGLVLGLCAGGLYLDRTIRHRSKTDVETTIYVPLKRSGPEACNDEPDVCFKRAVEKFCGGPDRYKFVNRLSSKQLEFVCIPPSSTRI